MTRGCHLVHQPYHRANSEGLRGTTGERDIGSTQSHVGQKSAHGKFGFEPKLGPNDCSEPLVLNANALQLERNGASLNATGDVCPKQS